MDLWPSEFRILIVLQTLDNFFGSPCTIFHVYFVPDNRRTGDEIENQDDIGNKDYLGIKDDHENEDYLDYEDNLRMNLIWRNIMKVVFRI